MNDVAIQDRLVENGVRGARAEDVGAIHALIETAARTTNVLARTRDGIFEHLRDFVVIEDAEGHHVLGCGALAVFTRNLAEIKSLVVTPQSRGGGLGRRLVEALLDEARRVGVRRVFALTDHPDFFARVGFRRVEKDTLPQKVWTECIRCPKYLHCEEEAVDIHIEPLAGEPKG